MPASIFELVNSLYRALVQLLNIARDTLNIDTQSAITSTRRLSEGDEVLEVTVQITSLFGDCNASLTTLQQYFASGSLAAALGVTFVGTPVLDEQCLPNQCGCWVAYRIV